VHGASIGGGGGGGGALEGPPAPDPGRLRLCYASLGFESHPHGQLTRGLFALHDRAKVQVVVFAFSADDGSAERADIAASAEHFVVLVHHPNPRAVMLSWQCGALIYLDGYIMRARPELFRRARHDNGGAAKLIGPINATSRGGGATVRRTLGQGVSGSGGGGGPGGGGGGIAPLQVACMYPGTLGTSADWDYYIADGLAAPPELRESQFAEQLLEMPYSYYVNDYARSYAAIHRPPPPPLIDRGAVEERLPPPAHFRFANFNQLFKVDGGTLSVWANLLRRRHTAVLWQLRNPAAGAVKLQLELHSRGVGSVRSSSGLTD
jgi:hypothetical protein